MIHLRNTRRLGAAILSILLVHVAYVHAGAPPTTQRAMGVRYDLPSFFMVVRPMQHPLDGRMPLLIWNLPMPTEMQSIWGRQSGSLRKTIDELARRGVAPTVTVPGGSGTLALARTINEAHQPIFLLNGGAVIENTAWRDCGVWTIGKDATHPGHERRWPCLALANAQTGANWVRQTIEPFKNAGLAVQAMFYDDEGLPSSDNGIYEAQAPSPEMRAHYPPGTFTSRATFDDYVRSLHMELEREVLVDPVHAVFPGALVGEFGDLSSTRENPVFLAGGKPIPPVVCQSDISMPALYANNNILPFYLAPGQPMTQERADQIYLASMLSMFSSSAANAKADHKKIVPYVGQTVPDNPSPAVRFGMTNALWHELQYHLWLRGADGMFIFNLGMPRGFVTADMSFHSVETVRSVYDQMLGYRDFLDHGQPMNYQVPPMFSDEPIWSGLRLKDRCLIRAFTPGKKGKSVHVPAFPNVTISLDGPPEGATYIIHQDGKIEKLAF